MSSFKLRKEKNCLNCGETVEKHFCPACGQENIEVKEDAFHMVVHAVADYFHFEHKFFRTLKPLLIQPGKLTAAYVAGKRVSFIHPIRLYIFVSIVFFLVILGGQAKENQKVQPKKQTSGRKLTEKEADSVVNEARKTMSYAPMGGQKREKLLAEMRESLITGKPTKSNQGWNAGNDVKFGGDWSTKDTTVAQYEKAQAALPKNKRDGFLKQYYIKRSIELNHYPNPKQKFIEGLIHNVPKMMFLILPIFAMILKLVYIRKKRYYFEHLIYSFHVHSALFLVVLIVKFLQWGIGYVVDIGQWMIFLTMIYMVWYIYRSLRTFYGSTRWITLLKMFFLFVCYNFVLTLGFIFIIALSFALA